MQRTIEKNSSVRFFIDIFFHFLVFKQKKAAPSQDCLLSWSTLLPQLIFFIYLLYTYIYTHNITNYVFRLIIILFFPVIISIIVSVIIIPISKIFCPFFRKCCQNRIHWHFRKSCLNRIRRHAHRNFRNC